MGKHVLIIIGRIESEAIITGMSVTWEGIKYDAASLDGKIHFWGTASKFVLFID